MAETAFAREKFAQLEDKISLSIILCESLKQQNKRLETALEKAQSDLAAEREEVGNLSAQIELLTGERREMKATVEEMLHAIAMLELEADSARK